MFALLFFPCFRVVLFYVFRLSWCVLSVAVFIRESDSVTRGCCFSLFVSCGLFCFGVVVCFVRYLCCLLWCYILVFLCVHLLGGSVVLCLSFALAAGLCVWL